MWGKDNKDGQRNKAISVAGNGGPQERGQFRVNRGRPQLSKVRGAPPGFWWRERVGHPPACRKVTCGQGAEAPRASFAAPYGQVRCDLSGRRDWSAAAGRARIIAARVDDAERLPRTLILRKRPGVSCDHVVRLPSFAECGALQAKPHYERPVVGICFHPALQDRLGFLSTAQSLKRRSQIQKSRGFLGALTKGARKIIRGFDVVFGFGQRHRSQRIQYRRGVWRRLAQFVELAEPEGPQAWIFAGHGPIRLKLRRARKPRLVCGTVDPQQAGKAGMRLFKRNLGQRLAGEAHDTMLGIVGVRNAGHRPPFHVACDAVVSNRKPLAVATLECAAALLVATEAGGAIGGLFVLWTRRMVRGVAGAAGGLPIACLVTLAEFQR